MQLPPQSREPPEPPKSMVPTLLQRPLLPELELPELRLPELPELPPPHPTQAA